MINIASTPSLGWPSSPAPAVAPVVAAGAVTPVQGSARESRAGLGFGQGGQAPQEQGGGRTVASAETVQAPAAPLLPRSQNGSDGAPVDAGEQLEAERRQAEEQVEELAKEQAVQQQLREVLSNVWQASAAVVERALGLEEGAAAAATQAPAEVGAVAGAPGRDAAASAAETVRTAEPEAYDEHGNSSWTPPELGGLISQRV